MGVEIKKGKDNRMIVIFPYYSIYVERIKSTKGSRWYAAEKYRDFLYFEVNQKRPNEHIHNAYMFLKWKDVRTNSDIIELGDILRGK